MKTFKTPKGTELPLLDLKGKDYLQVAQRIQWFREECPDWGIETDIITTNEKSSTVKATVKNKEGKIIATSHQTEKEFFDHLAKAETSAIGRALALCGFGTQFAQELEEGETQSGPRVSDSPQISKLIPNRAPGANPPLDKQVTGSWASYTLKTGKRKGTPLKMIGVGQAIAYQSFIEGLMNKGEKVAPTLKQDLDAIIEYRKESAQNNPPKSNNPGDFEPPPFEDMDEIPF